MDEDLKQALARLLTEIAKASECDFDDDRTPRQLGFIGAAARLAAVDLLRSLHPTGHIHSTCDILVSNIEELKEGSGPVGP